RLVFAEQATQRVSKRRPPPIDTVRTYFCATISIEYGPPTAGALNRTGTLSAECPILDIRICIPGPQINEARKRKYKNYETNLFPKTDTLPVPLCQGLNPKNALNPASVPFP